MAVKKKEVVKQNKRLRYILVALLGMQVSILLMLYLRTQHKDILQTVNESESIFPFWIIWIAVFVPVFVAKKNRKRTPEMMRVKYILLAVLGLGVLVGLLSFLFFAR